MEYFDEEYQEDLRKEKNARSNIVHIENAMRTIENHKKNGIQSKIKLNLWQYLSYPEANRGFIFMNTRCVDDYVVCGKTYYIRRVHIDHENPTESYLKIEWSEDRINEAVSTWIFFGNFLIDETESRSFDSNNYDKEQLYKKLRSYE
jgi:hypothetical protein